MKQITKYLADDGSEHNDACDCLDHESNCKKATAIISQLPERPEGCEYTNGSGYIQHDKVIFQQVKKEFLEFCKKYTNHEWIQQSIDDPNIDPSWPGRILGECLPNSIHRLWHRFSCTDTLDREWGQPYYVNNYPSDAKLLNA